MPHTSSLSITISRLEDAFNNNNVLSYLLTRMTQAELDRFFPPNILQEGSLDDFKSAAVDYNAHIANHGNDNENGSDPEFSTDIYKEFLDGDIADTERTTISSGLFSGGAASLSEFYFSPTLGDVSAS